MFGYVVVNRPELKLREIERYQKYYCGLCRCLKEHFGKKGQLSLSYDLTFLGILLSALYEPETEEKKGGCIIHPFQKKPYLKNECIDYAAEMNIILTYYKCQDDWHDEKKVGKLIYGKTLEDDIKELQEKYPDKCEQVYSCLKKTGMYEKRFFGRKINEKALDAIAGQSGKMMAEIFDWKEDEWSRELRTIGFYIGKFVYILDAYDDLEKDRKKHCFNPLESFCGREDFDDWVYGQLLMLASAAAKEFEALPVITDAEIIRNILYAGIWSRYHIARNRRNKDNNCSEGDAETKERRFGKDE